jgi:hypothetical protein
MGALDYAGRVQIAKAILPRAFIYLVLRTSELPSILEVIGNERQNLVVRYPLVFFADTLGFMRVAAVILHESAVEYAEPFRRPPQVKNPPKYVSLDQTKIESWRPSAIAVGQDKFL